MFLLCTESYLMPCYERPCQVFSSTVALNKHLLTCQANTSGHSAGLFCQICGKMFAQTKILKDHLLRHKEVKL